MDYKLAKQLKDVGFPQKGFETWTGDKPHDCYIPTLEELIEACGPDLQTLERQQRDGTWLALSSGNSFWTSTGTTSAEAIARL
jgi:hypothetical protein